MWKTLKTLVKHETSIQWNNYSKTKMIYALTIFLTEKINEKIKQFIINVILITF